MREFNLFDARFLVFVGIFAAFRFGGAALWQGTGGGEFPGYGVALVLAAGALLTWALGHGITPDQGDFPRTRGLLGMALRGRRAFDDRESRFSVPPSPRSAQWLHSASAALGVAAIASFGWAAFHDPERMESFLGAVGPLGAALAAGALVLAALMWAGWDLLFPPASEEPPAPPDA